MQNNQPPDSGIKTKILVVDDEKRIRDVCHRMLTREGFHVAVADNGSLGLEMIAEEHFDLVLLDLMMPGVSGLDVLTEIKGKHSDTVIIVITGYATFEYAVEAMKKGAFDFIAKPFSPEDLRLVVTKGMEYTRNLQDIANEKSRMRVLINHLADGVMATDTEKRVALANPAFLKMTGYRGKGVIGRPVEAFIQDKKLRDMVDQALNMPSNEFTELTQEVNHGAVGEDEETVLGVRCVPFRDRLGRNLGTITVMHDITTLKKMDKLKSDFVSMVAHEIKSPMNSVMAQIKVILDGLAGEVSEKQRELLGRVSKKIEGLATLSSELLDLSRIESGLITLEKERLDLGAILADQVAFYEPKARAVGLCLVMQTPQQLKPVLGNRMSMEEVASNLISNAVRYTPSGGEIRVSASVEKQFVRISISDTGIGIPEEALDKIFKRFYRIRNEKTRFIHGTGLGLAIVKQIVETHNGIISVESKPDRGTTFHVDIPFIEV